MNNGWRKWAWLALFCCWASSVAVRAETVRIAVGEWPPYISESLPHQGFLCEVVRQAFAESGLDISFHFYPWSKAYQLTWDGKYLITMPWFRSAERERDFYLSAALGHFTTRLFTLGGTPLKNLAELKGEPVGVTRGYFYGDGFTARQAALALEWSDSDEESMEKLMTGRIHYLVMDEQVARALFRQYKELHQITAIPDLVGYPEPVWSKPAYLLVRKSEPDARHLITLFNGGLLKLRRSGRLDELWGP
ncbi:substrate-binding periplasmic protein [Aeromonas australiensis]|uniref:substrate-binding periplasmic protein n=1 Tax=Aeromonas australiensis TaxID=1114880 RepID=UPI000589FC45|nr:transporter substrate-binding domain-containing protein [Aeromonas australiensis]MCF3098276.1 transporter substrate-binding domain-containing protein [Aeromonas australiensis]